MEENQYYNGTKLLNSKDKYGNKPEIYAVDGNRTAGKTTYFGRYFINRFKNHNERFIILVRFQNQLRNVDVRFFSNLHNIFFPNDVMTSKSFDDDGYRELYLNDKLCGWAIAINASQKIKENSSIFATAKRAFMDEFQAKHNKYCPDEVEQFISIHMSLARGVNEPVKYLPFIMCANHVTSLNPYYKYWGICNEADNVTVGFIKGDGFVVEKNMNEVVAKKQMESGFNRAFAGSKEIEHAIDNKAVEHNNHFIERIVSNNIDYLCNIIVDGDIICLKRVNDNSNCRYYFTDKIDKSMKVRFVINSLEHTDNTLLLGTGANILRSLRLAFDNGLVRFSDLETKDKAFKFLAINL